MNAIRELGPTENYLCAECGEVLEEMGYDFTVLKHPKNVESATFWASNKPSHCSHAGKKFRIPFVKLEEISQPTQE